MKKFLPVVVLCAFVSFVKAQNTFSQVYQILHTSCAGSGCHDGASPMFSVNLPEDSLYDAIFNKPVLNPAAGAKFNKLVVPGDVQKSYLLRKIAHGISDGLVLTQPQEGDYMPKGLPMLDTTEIELIRQWILFGAPETGNVVDTALINTYYRNGGIDDTYSPHAAPPAGDGFQIYLGRIFVRPNTEWEFFVKNDPHISQDVEVNQQVSMMPTAAHHFTIYKFFPGTAQLYPDGLRDISMNSHGDAGDGSGGGSGLYSDELPQGLAYYWPANTVLDINLHFKNTSNSILSTDMYVNVYTQPIGTAHDYVQIRSFPNFEIAIPHDNAEHEFTQVAIDTNETRMWNIYLLFTHTHRYGKDYDIWKRNADGSKGEQLYEGWYDFNYQFNQGYYSYMISEAARRTFDTLLPIDPRLGFIHTAKFVNNAGPDTVWWGNTSLDEMMVMGFQYIYGDTLGPLVSSVNDFTAEQVSLKVFPNPVENELTLNYTLRTTADVSVELTNILGETTLLAAQKQKPAGNYLESVDVGHSFMPGIYLLTMYTNGSKTTRRIVIE